MRKIAAFGEIKGLSEWLKDDRVTNKINYKSLYTRLSRGQSLEEAITKQVGKYNHNHNYFSEWSYENAWIIGFITADGSVTKNRLQIKLSPKDISILEYIKYQISPQNNIKIGTESTGFYDHKDFLYARLGINSPTIVQDLARYNIIPQKTGKEKLPEFPNKEIAYRYLLGLIDGDGSVICSRRTNRKNGYQRKVTITSASNSFLVSIINYFGFDANIYYGRSNCYVLYIGQEQQLIDMYHNLYDNGGFCLQRKKDKFIQIVKSYTKE